MLRLKIVPLLIIMVLASLLSGCNPTFELFAPEQELMVVTGILNPQKKVQYIKIVSVFQTEGDAYAFGAENDLSTKGLLVEVSGNGRTYIATEVDSIPKEAGTFNPQQTLYAFESRGQQELEPGVTYTLRVTKPDDPEFEAITAETIVPFPPRLYSPGKAFYNITNYMYSFPTVEFTEDFGIFFRKENGVGFEVRIYIEYQKDGQAQTAQWGPGQLFFESQRCGLSNSSDELCYEVPADAIPRFLLNLREREGSSFAFFDSPQVSGRLEDLSRVCKVEVTGIDKYLSDYLYSTNPFGFGLNLLLDKPELSNISGEHIGVFGSINVSANYVNISACTKYKAGIIQFPPTGCQ